MKRLSGTDALFLSMEQPNWHQHIGGLTILDRSDAPDCTFLSMRASMVHRLPLTPKFMWRLKEVPLRLDRAVWVDDPHFDIDRHLFHVALPAPGGPNELADLVGDILGRQLNRRRPLWEMWFIEGLPNDRVALLLKYHHCLLDGMASASLAAVMFDFAADAPPPDLPDTVEMAGPAPSDFELMARAVVPTVTTVMRVADYVGRAAQRGATVVAMAREGKGVVPRSVPSTIFNGSIGPKRRMAFASVAMDDVKAVKAHYGVKVNDVVLAICSGALRNYLLDRDALPAGSLITGVPVSTRAAGDESQENKLASMIVSLATDVDDAGERLIAIHASSQGAKEVTAAVRTTRIPSVGEIAPPALLNTALRTMAATGLIAHMPTVMNTLISNVPGPPFPLYFSGARVTGIFSSSVIVEGMGLNITLFSYMDRLDFGLHVDPLLVPDVGDIAEGFPVALAELMTAAGLGDPSVVEDPLGFTRP
ncbi:MAG: wax ester/triacylglycerol synthase family O-acyltransferase [Acidimicrobiales bacterium]